MTRWQMNRRSWLRGLTGAGALFGLDALLTAERTDAAAVGPNDRIKVTKIEAFVLKNSWVFVKVSTDAGISGWGEMLKDDAKACAAGALEVGDYLVGQDPLPRRPPLAGHPPRRLYLPRRPHQDRDYQRHRSGSVGHQGQGLRRARVQAARRADPRPRPRLRHDRRKNRRQRHEDRPPGRRERKAIKYIEGQKYVDEVVERFRAAAREIRPRGSNIGLDFHGGRAAADGVAADEGSGTLQSLVLRGDRAKRSTSISWPSWRAKTHVPIATGERIFTKWGFKEILEKRAAAILQPDVCYAGGITELKIIAGMAEAYYTPLAPHNPQGPCSLAASLQIAAAIPNFLIQRARRQRVCRPAGEAAAPGAQRTPPLVDRARPGHRHRRRQAAGPKSASPANTARNSTPTTDRWWIGKTRPRRAAIPSGAARPLATCSLASVSCAGQTGDHIESSHRAVSEATALFEL